MIIVRLMGGLGNQMFQYATARSLCSFGNKLRVDLDFFRQNNESTDIFTAREYELDIFSAINIQIVRKSTLNMFLKETFFCKLWRKICYPHRRTVRQTDCEFPVIPANTRNVYLDGFFQSEKFFGNIRDVILSDFTFPELDEKNRIILNRIKNSENSVSMHIRRGDYTRKAIADFHGILPTEYYEAAIQHLSGRISGQLNFFIFTDDPEWVKCHLPMDNSYIVEGNIDKNSWKDMALMTHCKHHIIANSSFSWWGAWLNPSCNKIVIAPDRWFKAMPAEIIRDLIPEKWTVLPVVE
jgi:hypothetical protein